MPAVQASAERGVLHVPRRGASGAPAGPDTVRRSRCRCDDRPRRIPRWSTRRLVRRRAAHRLPGLAARLPGSLGGSRREQGRRQRLGRDVRLHPGRVPPPRDQPGSRSGRRRLRTRPRRPGARRLPDARGTGSGHHLGRDERRQPQHLRRRRFRGGQPPDTASGGDAESTSPEVRPARPATPWSRRSRWPTLDVRPVPEVAVREHAFRHRQHADDAFRERPRRVVRVIPAQEDPVLARADGCGELLDLLAAAAPRPGSDRAHQ